VTMQVKVRFRFNAESGEVEVFTVDAVGADASAVDHDRRHDHATARLARVVEANASIEELHPDAAHTAAETDAGSHEEREVRQPERDRLDPSRG
jgi:hypothetical protein